MMFRRHLKIFVLIAALFASVLCNSRAHTTQPQLRHPLLDSRPDGNKPKAMTYPVWDMLNISSSDLDIMEREGEVMSSGDESFVDKFVGVMGPWLLPIPMILLLIPFGLAGIPLAFFLERMGHHPNSNAHHGINSHSEARFLNGTMSSIYGDAIVHSLRLFLAHLALNPDENQLGAYTPVLMRNPRKEKSQPVLGWEEELGNLFFADGHTAAPWEFSILDGISLLTLF